MRGIAFSYHLRSLFVRRSATFLTVLGIGATVAVVAGVLALQQGFERLYTDAGRADLAVFLRPGATGEGDSIFNRDLGRRLINTVPEIAVGDDQQPLASMELYLAVRLRRVSSGGETNVPIRGVQPATFGIREGEITVLEGRQLRPGQDELMVGRSLLGRIRGCELGGTIVLNTTPFLVVGIFESTGPSGSEIWGDLDRILECLERTGPSRVLAQLKPGSDIAGISARLKNDKVVPAQVISEKESLSSQTEMLSAVLKFLGAFLGVIMGIAAVFTATTTMLAALADRTHEIGILLAAGFRPVGIALGFLFESLILGLLGGLAGCLLVWPINGIETGTTNFQTFTEVAFGFRVTPMVLTVSILFALVLGLLGGGLPAWRAAHLAPVKALGRR
jgi:ABC-type antimicrobial peptide transport system permease subunit